MVKHNMLWLAIERRLKENDMTAYQLAQKAGIWQQSLSAIKTGKLKKPSFEIVCKIADALGVSLDELRKEVEK